MKDDKRSFRQKAGDFLSGRGFYIALTACVLVIGISAWTMVFTSGIADRTDVADNESGTSMAETQNSGYEDAITLPFVDRDKDKDTEDENAAGEGGSSGSGQETADNGGSEQPADSTDGEAPDAAQTEAPAGDDAAETMAPAEPLSFMRPVYGEISVGYFDDELVYNKTMMDWRTHSAVDIATELGARVMAVADGTVEEVYNDDLLGTTVVIDHGDGLKSYYSNLAATPTVSQGDTVTMGSVIGSVGNTAIGETGDVIHLHFAMTKDGVSVDPNDYLPSK